MPRLLPPALCLAASPAFAQQTRVVDDVPGFPIELTASNSDDLILLEQGIFVFAAATPFGIE